MELLAGYSSSSEEEEEHGSATSVAGKLAVGRNSALSADKRDESYCFRNAAKLTDEATSNSQAALDVS